MSLLAKIDSDLITALKAGEKEKVTLLRGLKSDIKYRQIEKGDDLSADDVLSVLSSAANRHRDSIEQFKIGNRDDLVKKESAELKIIESYLPEQMLEDEIRTLVKNAIAETDAESPAQIGLVMKHLMPSVKGKADGKLVNQIVRELLSGNDD
jgi:uncharacterized protein